MSAEVPLPAGKLPNDLLGALLARYVRADSSVIIGPGVGRDAAAIRVGDRALVVKTDPITFATADAGRYLVNVNANDIACMGATPRWLLATALFPERTTTPALVEEAFASLARAAAELGIALVGGHTEITLGLDRLILVGQMLGDADPGELLDPATAEPGDAVLLCGGVAVEGTAILATEARAHLAALPDDVIARAARLVTTPGISVLPAVRAIRESAAGTRVLHDPTEGGILSGVWELAAATGHGIELWDDVVRQSHVLPECRAICDRLNLDPLGLIASGALLAVVSSTEADAAIQAVRGAGIVCSHVGVVLASGEPSRLRSTGALLQPYPVDELARFFREAQVLAIGH